MRRIYYQTSGVTLGFDEDRSMAYAYAVWHGFLSSAEFREASLKCVELIEEKGITRWFADNRKMKAIRQADQLWFVENVMPRMLQSSLRRMATLVSEDMFNKMAVEQLMQHANRVDHLVLRDFNNETEAVLWLTAPMAIPTAAKSSNTL